MKYGYFMLALLTCFCSPKSGDVSDALQGDSVSRLPAPTGFDENNYESFTSLANYVVANPSQLPAIRIDSPCVIMVNPTPEQVSKMEEEYGDDFATIADDNSYYQAEAISKLDSASVKVIFAEKRYVSFVGQNETWTLDLRKEGAPEWNVIFYNPQKTPEIMSAIDVTYDRINEYFYR